jgi:nucleoid-associated protein EbfC
MAKHKGGGMIPPGGGMGGGMGGFGDMLAKMQENMEKAQAELETTMLEVKVGGGAVTVVISGHQRVQSISINQAVLDTTSEDWVTDLQDLLALGVNQAIEQSQALAAKRMEEVSGPMRNIPGLGGLLG